MGQNPYILIVKAYLQKFVKGTYTANLFYEFASKAKYMQYCRACKFTKLVLFVGNTAI